MIKAKQLPLEAVRTLAQHMLLPGADPRRALLAAIAAWPGMYTEPEREYGAVVGYTIFLPMPQETSDE